MDKILSEIFEKVKTDVPINNEDAKHLLTTKDILSLGKISSYIKTKLHQKNVYYSVNLNLNYTNICELRCPLCAYSCDKEDKEGFVLSLDEIESRVREAVCSGIDEVHIVGGLNPNLKLDYFIEMLKKIKSIKKDIFIVAFTAVEYDFFSKLNNMPIEEVFQKLIDAGVNALPGGGAEIFSKRVREHIAPLKISGEKWLSIMKTAHKIGLKTNATMLYNHIEDIDDIIDHLHKIRNIQDETDGFKTFVPLPFHSKNTKISSKKTLTTGYDDIRIFATSRIFLHNVPHIKVLWMYLGEKMAQILLNFGVDDFSGTYYNEKVVHAAGAKTPPSGSESNLIYLIKDLGLKPIKTNAGYTG
ncbi:MAG: CofH family radical SAM protein [Desulfobacterales bacterium]|nr:CofH family radical SAM protein [Desulfobacterales bacterium]